MHWRSGPRTYPLSCEYAFVQAFQDEGAGIDLFRNLADVSHLSIVILTFDSQQPNVGKLTPTTLKVWSGVGQ